MKGVPAAELKWFRLRFLVSRSPSLSSVYATVWPSIFNSTLVTPPLLPAALGGELVDDWASPRWRTTVPHQALRAPSSSRGVEKQQSQSHRYRKDYREYSTAALNS